MPAKASAESMPLSSRVKREILRIKISRSCQEWQGLFVVGA